jgi:hypothetical protein
MNYRNIKSFLILFFVLLGVAFSHSSFASELIWSENFDTDYILGALNGQNGAYASSSSVKIYDDYVISGYSVGSDYSTSARQFYFPMDYTLNESGYFTFDFYSNNQINSNHTSIVNNFGVSAGINAPLNSHTFATTMTDNEDILTYVVSGVYYYDEENNSFSSETWHNVGVDFWCDESDSKFTYNIYIDDVLKAENVKAQSGSCPGVSLDDFYFRTYYGNYRFDNIEIYDTMPSSSSTDDPLNNFVGYVNDSDYSIHLMRPSMGSLPNENVVMSVNPDPDFSTVWAVRFPSDKIDKTFITVRQCLDDAFEIDDCSIIYPITSVEDLGADGSKNVISFQLDFPVVLSETEYYLIQEWKELEDTSVEVVATAPLILTGVVDSTIPFDMDYYNETPDYGFFGNLLRDFFLPDSNFFVNNFNELNSLRQEKFSWYFTVKDEFSNGVAVLEDSSSDPPNLTLSLYDSAEIPIFNTTYIDSYMPTIRLWISAFLWLMFSIFIIRQASTILKS